MMESNLERSTLDNNQGSNVWATSWRMRMNQPCVEVRQELPKSEFQNLEAIQGQTIAKHFQLPLWSQTTFTVSQSETCGSSPICNMHFFLLWLISSFILLWSEKMLEIISLLLTLLSLVLCEIMWSILENVPWDLKRMCTLVLFKKIIYLFLLWTVLGLRYFVRTFSSCGEQGLLYSGAWASRCDGFSCCGAGFRHVGFSSCSLWALEHGLSSCGAWA